MLKVKHLTLFNTLRPRQNGRHFADDMFKCIFLNENVWIPSEISLKFVPKGSINNNPALFQIMAWRRPGDKPLSEPMMVSSLTHICVTRPQWVKPKNWKKRGNFYQGCKPIELCSIFFCNLVSYFSLILTKIWFAIACKWFYGASLNINGVIAVFSPQPLKSEFFFDFLVKVTPPGRVKM